MMILRAHIDKIAFGSGKQAVASFIAMVLTVLMSTSISVAAKDYGISNSRRGARINSQVKPQVRSPLEALKGPPTSMRDELVPRPSDQRYYDHNLAITGNVASGRGFQGSVPYTAPTDFQAPLGSTSLNSFIRRSTRTPDDLLSEGRSQPYYFPSKTVTSIRRGPISGLKAPVIRPQSQTPVFYKSPSLQKFVPPPIVEQPMRGRKRPFSFDSDEIVRKLSKKIKDDNLQIVDELLSDQDQAAEIKKILREFKEEESKKFEAEVLREMKKKKAELKEADLSFFREEDITGDVKKKPEPKIEKKSLEQETSELTKFIEEELGITPRKPKDKIAEMAKETEGLPAETEPDASKLTFQERLNELVPVSHQRAMELLGEHKDFESLARAKFATYRNLAVEFMKDGKYYDARDAWTLAEVWIADNPDSAIGKGNALFAAGEYMSCAYYIELALASSPEYATQKNELFQLVDEATIENQMGELTRVYEISKSYKIGFLLAHLNYQENKLDKAAEYLVAIKQQMNQSSGYQNLKKAVEKAIAQEGDK